MSCCCNCRYVVPFVSVYQRKAGNSGISVTLVSVPADGSTVTVREVIGDTQQASGTELTWRSGDPVGCVCEPFDKKDPSGGQASPSWRAAVWTRTHDVAFVTSKGVLWTRNEALASITGVQWVRLPDAETAAERVMHRGKGQGQASMWLQTVRAQAAQAWRFASGLASVLSNRSHADALATRTTDSVESDWFGLRQLAVVSTQNAQIFALRTDGGSVQWRADLAGLDYDGKIVGFFVSRPIAVPAGPAEVVAVVSYPSKLKSSAFYLNAMDGVWTATHTHTHT